MSLRLLSNKIAVIPLSDPDRTPSGLWVPDQAKQRIDQGIVKYRGPDCVDIVCGDHVFFSGYDGTKISIEGEGVLLIMRETYIRAVLLDGEAVQLFPLQEVERIIELAHGEFISRTWGEGDSISYYKDILLARFREWFFSEGLEF